MTNQGERECVLGLIPGQTSGRFHHTQQFVRGWKLGLFCGDAAGDFFDCGRVVPQACGLEGQSAVLLMEPSDDVGQLLPLVAHSDGLNESPITLGVSA